MIRSDYDNTFSQSTTSDPICGSTNTRMAKIAAKYLFKPQYPVSASDAPASSSQENDHCWSIISGVPFSPTISSHSVSIKEPDELETYDAKAALREIHEKYPPRYPQQLDPLPTPSDVSSVSTEKDAIAHVRLPRRQASKSMFKLAPIPKKAPIDPIAQPKPKNKSKGQRSKESLPAVRDLRVKTKQALSPEMQKKLEELRRIYLTGQNHI